jgi:hypothetical protein
LGAAGKPSGIVKDRRCGSPAFGLALNRTIFACVDGVTQNRISAFVLNGSKAPDSGRRRCDGPGFSSRVDLIGGKTLSLNLDDKKAVVAEVSAQVANAQTIVVAEYAGIEVGISPCCVLRRANLGVYLRVLKNTLARVRWQIRHLQAWPSK